MVLWMIAAAVSVCLMAVLWLWGRLKRRMGASGSDGFNVQGSAGGAGNADGQLWLPLRAVDKRNSEGSAIACRSGEAERLRFTPGTLCLYCGRPVDRADSCLLSDGSAIHKACFDFVKNDPFPTSRALTERVCDFWDGYPLDWPRRRAEALKRAGFRCQRCGAEGRPLFVHHLVPLGCLGGTNLPGNLMVLCAECHAVLHGNKDMTTDYDPTPVEIRRMVKAALAHTLRLRIVYTDRRGRETTRVIVPLQLCERAHRTFLTAYCTAVRATREFKLERIKNASPVG